MRADRALDSSLRIVAGVFAVGLIVTALEPVPDLWGLKRGLVLTGVLAVAASVFLAARFGGDRAGGRRDLVFLGALAAMFVATRAMWSLRVPTLPVSDFELYHQLATRVARGEPAGLRWPELGLMAAWGYPVVLGGAYALFVASLTVAKCFTVLLGAGALVATWALARRIAGAPGGRAAAALFLLWPGQLLYGPVVASEHLALPLVPLALLAVAATTERRDAALATALVAGAAVAVCFAIRSSLGTLLVAALGAVLIDARVPRRLRLVRSLAVLGGFVAVVALSRSLTAWLLGTAPSSAGWWSLLVGSNFASDGMWSLDDARRFAAYPDLASANRFARAEVWSRVSSDPLGYAGLVAAKMVALWADGGYPVFWSGVALAEGPDATRFAALAPRLTIVAQTFHAVTLMLGASGLLLAARRGALRGGILAAAIFLIVATLAHGVVEVQSRYNYCLYPALLAVAALPVATLAERSRLSA